jgi:hypothetical protein
MPQTYPHRNQLKYTRKPCRVRNWKEVESGLRRRGDLTIWFSEDALSDWYLPASSTLRFPITRLCLVGPRPCKDTCGSRAWLMTLYTFLLIAQARNRAAPEPLGSINATGEPGASYIGSLI